MRFLGVDLAWAVGSRTRAANETGVVALESSGVIADAGWTVGLDETVGWIDTWGGGRDALLLVDAPLVVNNITGQRICETHVGQRYGRWKVSANSTNLRSRRLAGVELRGRLEARGWNYDDGLHGAPAEGRWVSECYPYTTLVGAEELGYDVERPPYKRRPRALNPAEFNRIRAEACDGLIRRLLKLEDNGPPILLRSHPATRRLADEPSPIANREYKHREDLLDAVLCAWTASLWFEFGSGRCQVLGGLDAPAEVTPYATIIAPARPEQRGPSAFPTATERDALDRAMLEEGLLKDIPRPSTDLASYRDRELIVVEGSPLSETIIEERR